MTDNLNPHAEAIAAMVLWGDEYSRQSGGCMDFWDGLSPYRQRAVIDLVDKIADLLSAGRRALSEGDRHD